MPKKPTGRPTGRPATVAKKTTVSLRQGVDGWIEFQAMAHGGISAYLNDAAEADRAVALATGGEVLQRYQAYLVATGRDSELEAVDGEGQVV